MPHLFTLLDGPTGTELERHGFDTSLPLWSALANRNAPELLQTIHEEYIRAGADVVTANTFRTNRRAVTRSGLTAEDARELTRLGVELALAARERAGAADVLVAGSTAPVEDCYSPDLVPDDDALRAEHREHCSAMLDAGCDLLLVETMNTLREALIATEEACALGVPVWSSLVPDETGERLLSGESIERAVEAIAALGPETILVNCASPGATTRAVEIIARYRREHGGEWSYGGYPNGSVPHPTEGWSHARHVTTEEFVDALRAMLENGATVIGGCCGTTPEMLAVVRDRG